MLADFGADVYNYGIEGETLHIRGSYTDKGNQFCYVIGVNMNTGKYDVNGDAGKAIIPGGSLGLKYGTMYVNYITLEGKSALQPNKKLKLENPIRDALLSGML